MEVFPGNLVGFKPQICMAFHGPPWGFFIVSLIKINGNHKTQSSKQNCW